MNKKIIKEGLYNPEYHTYMHITNNSGIIDCLPKSYKHILKIEKENINLKQVLNKIRKIICECKMLMPHEFDWNEQGENILQIIAKVLEGDKDE